MRIAHISDLHLGKIVHSYQMLDEQKIILKQIVECCQKQEIDTLLIAGDVYDRPVASSEAIALFEDFLEQLVSHKIKILIIGGNHDGYQRLNYAKKYLQMANIYIKADYRKSFEKISIDEVDFYLVNYFDPIHFEQLNNKGTKIKTHDEMMQVLSQEILSDLNSKQTNILMAHGYFANLKSNSEISDYQASGLITSQSERPLSIGTSDIVNINHFAAFDYIALGHLHQQQQISENAFYSGAIYPYAFNEKKAKGMYIFDTETKNVQFEKFIIERKLKTIQGTYEIIMNIDDINYDYVEIVLTQETLINNLMDKVKQKYPNTMLIRTLMHEGQLNDNLALEDIKTKSSIDLFSDFCQQVYQYDFDEQDIKTFRKIIEEGEDASN